MVQWQRLKKVAMGGDVECEYMHEVVEVLWRPHEQFWTEVEWWSTLEMVRTTLVVSLCPSSECWSFGFPHKRFKDFLSSGT